MTRRKLAKVAVIASLLAGCGGGGGGKPTTESDFCAQKADAECQVTDQCVTTKDACKAQRMTMCTAFVADAKASKKRVFVPGNIGNCINKTKNVYSKTAPITPTEMADMNEACNYVFQGDGEVRLQRQGHLRQGLLRAVEERDDDLRQPGRHMPDRAVLHGERFGREGLHAEGRERRRLQRRGALPREPALQRRELRGARGRGRRVHVQRRLLVGRSLLRSVCGQQV